MTFSPLRSTFVALLVALAACRAEEPEAPEPPLAQRDAAKPKAASELPAEGSLRVGWDPTTGRGDVIQRLVGGDLLRTCFHCRFDGYTGGLLMGNQSGSGAGLYPRQPIRGFRSINVWCAQDESIFDHTRGAELTYGWSENYGTGRDGERLEYVGGRVIEAGPQRAVLRSENEGGCYRVSKVATARADGRFWILATRLTNRCQHPIHFDFFSGEDPWIGLYRSSDGDVGWTRDGLVRYEAALGPGEFTAGGLYDLGNQALGQPETGFSNQANFYLLDPATPLPDVVLFANSFAHHERDIDPRRPLDNRSLTAINLGWKDRRLAPGEGMTVAFAMGLAQTGEPGTVPRVPELGDADWSLWRQHLPEGNAPAAEVIEFAAERVEIDVRADGIRVDGRYTLRSRGSSATATTIVYPVLVAADRPAPAEIRVDGRSLAPHQRQPGTVEVRFPVAIPPRSIARFRVVYEQPHHGQQAAYMVTSARSWPTPIGRAVFVIRHPEALGEARVSFPGGRVRRHAGRVTRVVALSDFRPDRELAIRWGDGP